MTFKGSCLCGAIAYEVDGFLETVSHCACRTCQKSHAAAFNSSAKVADGAFRWLRGEALLKGYESSPGKIRWFCSECGSQLVAKRASKNFSMLRVATLDADPGLRPDAMLWLEDASPWLDWRDGVDYHQREIDD